ncbi:MAG TPA: patatin-like phospholipase family protein [Gemmatimonadota bacterium]|nr:patatin-like phospholipase family protein [Gemmatimonadota bacterium]
MTSALVYQWLFLRLSPRFSLPFLAGAAAYFTILFPSLLALAERSFEQVLPFPTGRLGGTIDALATTFVVAVLVAAGFLLALWFGTWVYRLLPPRPAAWRRDRRGSSGPRAPAEPKPLGRYRRIGIILAGGGAKGAYQAGALSAIHRFLTEREALGSVRMIAATSIGAWNACFWLADLVGGEQPSVCETWWSRVRLSEIVTPTYYVPGLRNYVLSADPWREAFRTLFTEDPAARERFLSHLTRPGADDTLHFYLTRTNVQRAHLEFSTNREDLTGVENASGLRRPLVPPDRWVRARTIEDVEQAVFASMDLPPLFEYTRFGDELFEDGGVIENLPIYFGTGIEKCDLLFVLPLNASFAAEIDQRSILDRLQRLVTIRQGALERKALKDVYLYNELAVLRDRLQAGSLAPARDRPQTSEAPAGSAAALREAASVPIAERAAGRVHRPVQIFAVAPDEPLLIDTVEFWRSAAAGRAFRLMEEHAGYELAKFDFDREPDWIRVALIGPQGEVRYLEDF